MRAPEETYVDVGDARLCVWRWHHERTKRPILFLHATGFHARLWDAIIEAFPDHPCYAADLRFHGQSSKEGTVDWPLMGQDVIDLIEALELRDFLLVGHSIGGYLSTLAAAAYPDRVRELLLLDPVIMSPERYALAKQMETMVKPDDHPGAKRRNEWSGPEEMIERFRERKPFDRWTERALHDYCAHALTDADKEDVRQLLCDPLHEVQVYIRHNGPAIAAAMKKVEAPTTIVRAVEPKADEMMFDFSKSPTWPELAQSYAHARDIYRDDLTHFIPMEDPDLVVGLIREALAGEWHAA